jgi:hypothetical protein
MEGALTLCRGLRLLLFLVPILLYIDLPLSSELSELSLLFLQPFLVCIKLSFTQKAINANGGLAVWILPLSFMTPRAKNRHGKSMNTVEHKR